MNDKMDFSSEGTNNGDFIATLQLLAKENKILHKHLLYAKKNVKYTSKTIQNYIIHNYASKIRNHLTKDIGDNKLLCAIICDECTDPHSNQEVLSMCLGFVQLSPLQCPTLESA